MTGLLPDREYTFVVVSRDVAGNASTDNNGGRFHTFRTLAPVQPPWLDDLESGTEGWAVYNDESILVGAATTRTGVAVSPCRDGTMARR